MQIITSKLPRLANASTINYYTYFTKEIYYNVWAEKKESQMYVPTYVVYSAGARFPEALNNTFL